jgi:eukaryotic-like serine/threonine-protein kinase
MSSQYWRKEKVSFQAAYGKERVIADLYLPKNAVPRYQIVLFFPGSPGLTEKVLDPYEFRLVELILRSERAVILPSYKGYLERGPTPNGYLDRELTLHWSKDLGRSIDYIETRSDIDIGKLAYLGYSLGAWQGPRLVAVEPRIKAAVLAATCSGNPVSPEVDPWNFVPRVKIPPCEKHGIADHSRLIIQEAHRLQSKGHIRRKTKIRVGRHHIGFCRGCAFARLPNLLPNRSLCKPPSGE